MKLTVARQHFGLARASGLHFLEMLKEGTTPVSMVQTQEEVASSISVMHREMTHGAEAIIRVMKDAERNHHVVWSISLELEQVGDQEAGRDIKNPSRLARALDSNLIEIDAGNVASVVVGCR